MSDAFDLILGICRSPARAPLLRKRKLPDDAIDIIRIAAADAEALAFARETTRLSEAELTEAAGLLLHHLLFFEGADSYRTLGVHPNAEPAQIKHHYRWLVRWLHPDRDPDNMHSVFAERINRAWNSIRNAERRASYDQSLALDGLAPERGAEPTDPAVLLRSWAHPSPAPLLSGRVVRRLPQVVAIGGAIVAAILFTFAVWLHSVALPRTSSAMAIPAARATPDATTLESSVQPSWPAAESARVRSNVEPGSLTKLIADAASSSPASVAATSSSFVVLHAANSDVPVWQSAFVVLTPPAKKKIDRPIAASARSSPMPASVRPEAPPSASIQSTQRAEVISTLSESELAQFVDRFQRLYAANDVDQFLALFSTEAKGNGAGGFADIAADYRRLFGQRGFRQLSLSDMKWQIHSNVAIGQGRYDAVVGATVNKPESRTHGSITLGLRRNPDGLLITQLRHVLSE